MSVESFGEGNLDNHEPEHLRGYTEDELNITELSNMHISHKANMVSITCIYISQKANMVSITCIYISQKANMVSITYTSATRLTWSV